jgi:hypothetical protein
MKAGSGAVMIPPDNLAQTLKHCAADPQLSYYTTVVEKEFLLSGQWQLSHFTTFLLSVLSLPLAPVPALIIVLTIL